MPDHLLGTEVILKAMLENGKHERDARPYHERYNLIMQAIYGPDAKEHYITHEPGRLEMKTIHGLGVETILVQMYEFDPEEKIPRETLARSYIDLLESSASDKSKATMLAKQYRKHREFLKNEEYRQVTKELARIQIRDGGYVGIYAEGINDIARTLRHWDWPV